MYRFVVTVEARRCLKGLRESLKSHDDPVVRIYCVMAMRGSRGSAAPGTGRRTAVCEAGEARQEIRMERVYEERKLEEVPTRNHRKISGKGMGGGSLIFVCVDGVVIVYVCNNN